MATLAMAAVAVAHTVMVAVMVMTPVHMHHGGATLQIIGFVISGHVAGMYALSPLMGWLVDRIGRVAVIGLGIGILAMAFALAGTAPSGHSAGLATGLVLLGVGWSACLIAGSTLLTESVPVATRPAVQGANDLVMGLGGAIGGAFGGVVVGTLGFGWLAVDRHTAPGRPGRAGGRDGPYHPRAPAPRDPRAARRRDPAPGPGTGSRKCHRPWRNSGSSLSA